MSKPFYRRLIRDGEIVGVSMEVLIYFDMETRKWSHDRIKHDTSMLLSSPPMIRRPTLSDIMYKRKKRKSEQKPEKLNNSLDNQNQ